MNSPLENQKQSELVLEENHRSQWRIKLENFG